MYHVEKQDFFLKADPPFLNHFEKHFFKLTDYFDERLFEILKELEKWFLKFLGNNNREINLTINYLFPNYNKNILCLVILKNQNLENEDLIKEVKKTFLKNSPVDIISLIEFLLFEKNEKDFICEIWKKSHKNTLSKFIETILKNENKEYKHIAFISQSQVISKLNSIFKNNIETTNLNIIKSEKALKNRLNDFYQSKNKLLILELDPLKNKKLLSFLINNIEKIKNDDYLEIKKSVLININIHRNILFEKLNGIDFNKNWDSCRYQKIGYKELINYDFSNMEFKDLIKIEEIFNEEKFLEKNIENIFYKFIYETPLKKNIKKIKKHIDDSKFKRF